MEKAPNLMTWQLLAFRSFLLLMFNSPIIVFFQSTRNFTIWEALKTQLVGDFSSQSLFPKQPLPLVVTARTYTSQTIAYSDFKWGKPKASQSIVA